MASGISRRECPRTVPMEVLCLGRERTGTASIRAALRQLGYNDVYHMYSVLDENPSDSFLWSEAFDAKFLDKGHFNKNNWDQLFGHCMATCDEPGAYFAEELIEAYPLAKVILTVRDSPEVWLDSVLKSTYRWAMDLVGPSWSPFVMLRRRLLRRPPFLGMLDRLYKVNGYFMADFPTVGSDLYARHNSNVRELAVRRGKLSRDGLGANGLAILEFNVKVGRTIWQRAL
ncbi:MAG: hypothetical protein Q9195_008845 [Heterodermia aff. obscurata]